MRNIKIDIVKGIGIILMVMGHACCPFSSFFFLFHMAIFFIASGYLYNGFPCESINDAKSFLFKKIKSLYFPYVLWNTIFILCHNFFINLNFYDKGFLSIKEIFIKIVKGLLLGSGTEMGGALWFVAVLFTITITFYIIDYIISRIKKSTIFRNIVQGIISILALILGFIYQKKSSELFSSSILTICLSCYFLFYMGILFKIVIKGKNINTLYSLLIVFISSIALFVLSKLGYVALNGNSYTDPIFLIVCSLLGWAWIYSLSTLISKIKYLNNCISYLGQNTMPIVILHFMCFKIITLLGIIINNDDITKLSSFPTLYQHSLWWLLYTFIGISIPILLSNFFHRLFVINIKNSSEK